MKNDYKKMGVVGLGIVSAFWMMGASYPMGQTSSSSRGLNQNSTSSNTAELVIREIPMDVIPGEATPPGEPVPGETPVPTPGSTAVPTP